MEALNGSHDDKYLNRSHFDEPHNVSGSKTFYNNEGFTFWLFFYLLWLFWNFIPPFFITCRKKLSSYMQSFNHLIFKVAMIKPSAYVVFLFFFRYAPIDHSLKCRQCLNNSLVFSASLAFLEYSFIAISLKYFIKYLSNNYTRKEEIELDLIPVR